MFKLLVILFIIKLYAGNDIFKPIYDYLAQQTFSRSVELVLVTSGIICQIYLYLADVLCLETYRYCLIHSLGS